MGKAVIEVKNVAYMYLSSQIKAEIALATEKAIGFILVVKKGAELAQPLTLELQRVGAVLMEYDPVTKALTEKALGG